MSLFSFLDAALEADVEALLRKYNAKRTRSGAWLVPMRDGRDLSLIVAPCAPISSSAPGYYTIVFDRISAPGSGTPEREEFFNEHVLPRVLAARERWQAAHTGAYSAGCWKTQSFAKPLLREDVMTLLPRWLDVELR